MCNKHMKIVLFLNKTIIIEPKTHRSFRYGQYRGGRGVGWAGGGPVLIWAGRKVRWVDDVKISKMKIVLFFDKTIETHRKNHRPYRYRYYRGGTRVGEAGGGQRGRRVLLQLWCDGWRSPHEVSNVIPVYLFKYMVTHLNIAAFCSTYTRAGDGEVSGLLLIGSPSNERRKSHGSIDRDVERSCGVVCCDGFFFGVNSCPCVRDGFDAFSNLVTHVVSHYIRELCTYSVCRDPCCALYILCNNNFKVKKILKIPRKVSSFFVNVVYFSDPLE